MPSTAMRSTPWTISSPIDYYDFALKINKALGLLKKHREKETF